MAQNLELGMEKWVTVYSKINIAATQSLQSMNFNVDPLVLVENLATAKRQMVEIVRAVRHNAQVFIFDEPTASLTPEETQHLFHLLNTLKEKGAGIIFISHALKEALNIADRITVLRDGKLVATVPAKDVTRDSLVRMMVGREETAAQYATHGADPDAPKHSAPRGQKVLSVENVTMGSIVKNMSFSVFNGEVWPPKERVPFSGDLVEYNAGIYTGDAHLEEWPNTLDKLRALKPRALVPGRGPALTTPAQCEKAIRYTQDFVRGLYASARRGVASRQSLRQVYQATKRRMDPVYGRFPIYEHCMPFDVSRAYDEARGIKHPRIWTARRDVEMWKSIA